MTKTALPAAAAVLLALGLAEPLRAQEPAADCRDPKTQLEMNECAWRDYRAADAELNRVYARLVARLDSVGRVRLRAAQRAWLPFRDAQCVFEASGYEGGSLHSFLQGGCLAHLTRERTKQLEAAEAEEG